MNMLLTSVTTSLDEALSYLKQEAGACWQATVEAAFRSAKFSLEACVPASQDDYVWLSCDLSPIQFGYLAFGSERAAALALGRLLLSAKGRPSEHDHHALHATTHLMGQFAASLARHLSERLNTTLAAADCSPAAKAPDSAHHFTIPIAPGQIEGYSLTISPSPDLLSALGSLFSADGTTTVLSGSQITPRNLELLLDLEMPVSVSFGTTRLALKDVAKLTTGSIVELNRALSEPVDIIVNNCAIARGEVVVIDGNFGVRINQVISKQDRLRSLS